MNIYWTTKQIPACKGLALQEREALIKTVWGKVWRHWQVWFSQVIQIVVFILLSMFLPQIPYRLFVLILFSIATMQIAFLPRNHYIHYYLSQSDIFTDSEAETEYTALDSKEG